jgi:hypothetical protein
MAESKSTKFSFAINDHSEKIRKFQPFPINGLGAGFRMLSEHHDADDSRPVRRRHGRMVRAYAQLDLKLKGVVEAIDEPLTGKSV